MLLRINFKLDIKFACINWPEILLLSQKMTQEASQLIKFIQDRAKLSLKSTLLRMWKTLIQIWQILRIWMMKKTWIKLALRDQSHSRLKLSQIEQELLLIEVINWAKKKSTILLVYQVVRQEKLPGKHQSIKRFRKNIPLQSIQIILFMNHLIKANHSSSHQKQLPTKRCYRVES